MSTLLVSKATDVGLVRDHNEDGFDAVRLVREDATYELLVVADGMGGHAKGEVASALALETVREYMQFGSWADPASALRQAFTLANERVHAAGNGMGTTLVAALFRESSGQFWVENVGDSRAYLLQRGRMRPLTRDHSEVAVRVEAGQLTREQADRSKGRNVLLRAIGPDETVESDGFGPFRLRAGQRLLLCSDGLHAMVPEKEIAGIGWVTPLGAVPDELIRAANDAGGKDNITVVAAALPGDGETIVERGLTPAAARPRALSVAMAAAVFLGVGGIAAFAIVTLGGGGPNPSAAAVGTATQLATSSDAVVATATPPPLPTQTAGATTQPTAARATATSVPPPSAPAAAAAGGAASSTPTASAVPTSTATPTPTTTPTPTATATPSATSTPTAIVTTVPTNTPTPHPTVTPTSLIPNVVPGVGPIPPITVPATATPGPKVTPEGTPS